MCLQQFQNLSVENQKTDITSQIKHLRNSSETASKTQNKRIFQTALLYVGQTKRVETTVILRQ